MWGFPEDAQLHRGSPEKVRCWVTRVGRPLVGKGQDTDTPTDPRVHVGSGHCRGLTKPVAARGPQAAGAGAGDYWPQGTTGVRALTDGWAATTEGGLRQPFLEVAL